MDELIQSAGAKGVQEIVIGMAHRGRLNVLVNTLGKMPKDLFAEFDHTAPEDLPAGDVKYHQGFSSTGHARRPGAFVAGFNPSHRKSSTLWLKVRCVPAWIAVAIRVAIRYCPFWCTAIPLSVAKVSTRKHWRWPKPWLHHWRYGSPDHQQPDRFHHFRSRDMRSTAYCTDIVKMVEAPVLHVNGDDPEAVCWQPSWPWSSAWVPSGCGD